MHTRGLLLALGALMACSDERTPTPGAPDAASSVTDAGAADSGAPVDAGDGLVHITFDVTVPRDTPLGDVVHIAGDFQNWDPTDVTHRLTRIEPYRYTIELAFTPGRAIEFKFARGDWALVEKDAQGAELPNRTLTADASGTQAFTVASWSDLPPTPSSITGDVTTRTVPGFLSDRRVWIYLPPGYAASTTTTYPVLYMLDGQNLFDRRTSFSGEWQVDEALEAGIAAGEVEPIIVVGIDNGGGERIAEYTPWEGTYMGEQLGGGGPAHLRAIIDVLKPWVDTTYRTRSGAADTGIAGSSLGGLMSLYAAYAHRDVFGRIGGLSPSVWWDDEELVTFVGAEPKPSARIWTDMGTAEGETPPFRRLVAALLADGFVEGQDLRAVEVPGAPHNEGAWSSRFPQVLRFLFPPR